MGLSEAQKIKVRKILGVYKEMNFTGFLAPYGELENRLDLLTADQVTEVESILAEYAKVEFSTGVLSGDFSDDPVNRRQLIKEQMVLVVNFNPRDYGIGGMGLSIGRA